MMHEMHIVELEMDGGDPGYFTHGHVNKTAFVFTVNAVYGESFAEGDADHVCLTQARPDWQEPGAYGDGDNYYWVCEADVEGAFPATFVQP